MVDCEKYFGRNKDLCLGQGLDGRKLPRQADVDWFYATNNLGDPPKVKTVVTLSMGKFADEMLAKEKAKPVQQQIRTAPLPPKPGRVGQRLHEIFQTLGFEMKPNCACRSLMGAMDHAGVEGCKTRREEFIDKLRKNADKFGITAWQKMYAAAAAVVTGLAFKIDPRDPIPGCFDEAVQRELNAMEQ